MTTPPVDLDRIEALFDCSDPNEWRQNAAREILNAAPAMVAELRALRAEVAKLRITQEADEFARDPVKREAFLRNLRDPNR